MAEELEAWFKSEVLTHEGILMKFLGNAWPRHADLADLRQEIYIRVYEAALKALPQRPKAFIFGVARHVLLDRRRRERIVSIQSLGENDFSNDLMDEGASEHSRTPERLVDQRTPERWVGARQEFARLARAFDRLKPTTRKVVWMRRVQDLPQRTIAERLGVSEKAVEYHICIAGRLLAQYMQQSGGRGDVHEEARTEVEQLGDNEHGE